MFFKRKNKNKDKDTSRVIRMPKNADVPPVNKYQDILDKYKFLDKYTEKEK